MSIMNPKFELENGQQNHHRHTSSKVGERTRRAGGRNDVTNKVALACDEETQAPNSCMEQATETKQPPSRCSRSSHRRHQPIKVTSTSKFTESWNYHFFQNRRNIVQNPNPHNIRHMTDTMPIHSQHFPLGNPDNRHNFKRKAREILCNYNHSFKEDNDTFSMVDEPS
ncbi:hypothetical protein M0R45_025458 [Rubus argutus]|uniref:Uncharacterized protein n=1 Tax=Rubus argutus TaxID=59490 RepID=A0AAW1WWC1_RUBAR